MSKVAIWPLSRDCGWKESLITKPKGYDAQISKIFKGGFINSLKEGLSNIFSLKLGKLKVQYIFNLSIISRMKLKLEYEAEVERWSSSWSNKVNLKLKLSWSCKLRVKVESWN